MSMYFYLLRTSERIQDDCIRKAHALLVSTGINTRYGDQEAIAIFFEVGRRSGATIDTSKSPVPKLSRVTVRLFVAAKKKSDVYCYFE